MNSKPLGTVDILHVESHRLRSFHWVDHGILLLGPTAIRTERRFLAQKKLFRSPQDKAWRYGETKAASFQIILSKWNTLWSSSSLQKQNEEVDKGGSETCSGNTPPPNNGREGNIPALRSRVGSSLQAQRTKCCLKEMVPFTARKSRLQCCLRTFRGEGNKSGVQKEPWGMSWKTWQGCGHDPKGLRGSMTIEQKVLHAFLWPHYWMGQHAWSGRGTEALQAKSTLRHFRSMPSWDLRENAIQNSSVRSLWIRNECTSVRTCFSGAISLLHLVMQLPTSAPAHLSCPSSVHPSVSAQLLVFSSPLCKPASHLL